MSVTHIHTATIIYLYLYDMHFRDSARFTLRVDSLIDVKIKL